MNLSAIISELLAERGRIDTAITALRSLDRGTLGGPLSPSRAVSTATTPTVANQAVEMKRQGMKATQIAKALGIKPSAVYTLTKGVKRGKAAPAPSSGPERRCGACEQIGTADPCEHCGEAR